MKTTDIRLMPPNAPNLNNMLQIQQYINIWWPNSLTDQKIEVQHRLGFEIIPRWLGDFLPTLLLCTTPQKLWKHTVLHIRSIFFSKWYVFRRKALTNKSWGRSKNCNYALCCHTVSKRQMLFFLICPYVLYFFGKQNWQTNLQTLKVNIFISLGTRK